MAILSEHLQRMPRDNAQADSSVDFDAVFLAHWDRVYGILYRLVGNRAEAEDLAQDVFVKLYQQPPRRADSNIGAWLYRVATNSGYNALRGRNRQQRWYQLLWRSQPQTAPDPEQQLADSETTAAVRAALATLTPQQGQLLLLRHMGLSYAELAAACDLNPNSVGKQLSRAAAAFRSAMTLASVQSGRKE